MTRRHDDYWAGFLGIDFSDWDEPGVSVRAHVGLAGYRGAWVFTHNDRTVISAPISWVAHLEHFDTTNIDELFAPHVDRVIGPTYIGALDPARFAPRAHPDARPIDPIDDVGAFRSACGADDWETSGLDEAPKHVAGVVRAERILAMAGYRPRTEDVGDLCVLTHPDHRGEGLGAAAASVTTAGALDVASTLLYQTLDANVGSVRIATSLGFERYATNVAVRLTSGGP